MMDNARSPTFELEPLPNQIRRVLVYIAMEAEAIGIADALGCGVPTRFHANTSVVSRECTHEQMRVQLLTAGYDPVLGVDRIGPLPAALAVSHALDQDAFDLIINAGTAGGFQSQGSSIGELILARDTQFHDCRVALPKFDLLARAHTRLSCTESQLESLAAQIHARVGRVSTSSSLDATREELALFSRENMLAKEMELGAIAMVARERRVPLVALKSITDFVDGHEPNHVAFTRNLAVASGKLATAMPRFLKWISDQQPRPARSA